MRKMKKDGEKRSYQNYLEGKSMKVIIYGCGRRYYNLFGWHEYVDLGMITNEVEVVGFADGNPDFWGKRIVYNGNTFQVKNIEEYPEKDYDKIMVTTKDYFEEIHDILIRQGYKEEKIFLIDDIFEHNLELISSRRYFLLNRQWGEFCRSGNYASFFFKSGNYRDIAICGLNEMAEQLIHLCRKSGIRIQYLIDTDATGIFKDLPIFQIDSKLPKVDIIVVTTDNYMWYERELCKKNNIEVISIQEVIYKTLKNAKRE